MMTRSRSEFQLEKGLTHQITALEQDVKARGVSAANEIVENCDPNVIKLAFRYVRRREKAAGPTGLGSRIEGLLEEMDAKEAATIRNKLLAAKEARAGV